MGLGDVGSACMSLTETSVRVLLMRWCCGIPVKQTMEVVACEHTMVGLVRREGKRPITVVWTTWAISLVGGWERVTCNERLASHLRWRRQCLG